MNVSSPPPAATFSILCLGQRGVGKTVFLAGSYAELHSSAASATFPDWNFECQDNQDWQNLQTIFSYIQKTGSYPPPTMKITDFQFSLQFRPRRENQTVNLRWWDVPGEQCNFQDAEFQKLVLDSHSCCVLVDAYRLVNDPDYQPELAILRKQVGAIANLIADRHLPYAFAIIFTQCDRLDSGPIAQLQVEEKLQDFMAHLQSLPVKYQRFFAGVPIVAEGDDFKLAPSGAASALLWLVSELTKAPKYHAQQSLGMALQSPLPAKSRWQTLPSLPLPLVGAAVGLLAIGVGSWFAFSRLLAPAPLQSASQPQSASQAKIERYQEQLQSNPDDYDNLVALTNTYLEEGQVEEAIPLLEKIVQQQPGVVGWQLTLAYSYELKGNSSQAEASYDRILAENKNHWQALVGKARIRSQQGDIPAAKQLFQQAETAAGSSELKAQVRKMAKQSLARGQ